MPQFRKRPLIVDAFQWEAVPTTPPDWMPPVSRDVTDEKWPGQPSLGQIWRDEMRLWIGTREGAKQARPRDWIVRNGKGEIYPVSAEAFTEAYEPA